MDNDTPPPTEGSSALTMVLAVGTMGAFLIFLILLTNGWILWMILSIFVIGALGFFHYWTWGRSLMQATEAEREQAQREAEKESGW